MKAINALTILLLAGAQSIAAFPHYAGARDASETSMLDILVKRDVLRKKATSGLLPDGTLLPFTGLISKIELPTPMTPGVTLVPDAAHPYQAPGPTDQRGPCPGLNTMANHGYVNRNGIITYAQAVNACQQTYGVGYDYCNVLATLGLMAGGDMGTGTISLGGPDSRVPNTFGTPKGIDNHGPFEIDGSMSRNDTYFGDNHSFSMERWNQNREYSKEFGGGLYNDTLWRKERRIRYLQSKETNPNFFAGAKYQIVTAAERSIGQKGLPNNRGPNIGKSTPEMVEPFFIGETFPPDWYKRGTPYSLPMVVDDINSYLSDPDGLTPPGQNQGLGNWISFNYTMPPDPYELGCAMFTILADFGVSGMEADAQQAAAELVEQAMYPFFKKDFNCNFSGINQYKP